MVCYFLRMGDTCCNPESMGYIKRIVEKTLPGIFVHSLEIGDSTEADQWNGFFLNVNTQIEMAWKQISKNSNLSNGFNAMGFSQGSQFLRGYIERYNNPPIYNLISIGGQHQGVYGFPKCPGANETICEWVRDLLDLGVYIDFVQENLVQAEYWQDPWAEAEYVAKSLFLADINNVRDTKNSTYKQNLITINKFAMVRFNNDTMVQPIASEWFGWYEEGTDNTTIPLQQTALYTEDWIGMQVLDKANKLQFIETNGDHLQFTEKWFIDNIIPLLNNKYFKSIFFFFLN